MIFGRKKEDAKETESRDRLIRFKKVFGSLEGKEVLFDLMNRFHILNAHGGDPFSEGQRSVVLHILGYCNLSVAEFDRLLNVGENE